MIYICICKPLPAPACLYMLSACPLCCGPNFELLSLSHVMFSHERRVFPFSHASLQARGNRVNYLLSPTYIFPTSTKLTQLLPRFSSHSVMLRDEADSERMRIHLSLYLCTWRYTHII
ncbi:Uncharacterized protein TCM_011245 [Theobroma cacao]|uniref:Uncharacterized protein n=1 Tax=Theobroma cacao TaxID=3641 RepID=A0A061EAA1_THECC|nr:Uncharacterized protein TCM_011245 [Theobroma cacao]